MCRLCGRTFAAYPSDVAYGGAIYCSLACRYAGSRIDPAQSFWRRVEKSDGCWLWTGPVNWYGYGLLTFRDSESRKTRGTPAHRFSYELHFGEIGNSEIMVCHRCDNRRCVRPEHLFLGRAADNAADMVRKGRSARGERDANARLTAGQVLIIRERFAAGESTYDLAEAFGVSQSAAHSAATGLTWRHIDGVLSADELAERRSAVAKARWQRRR